MKICLAGGGGEKEKESVQKGGSQLENLELQECLALCEKLRRELEDASYIPEIKLSGELAEALKEIRNYQKLKLEKIMKEVSMVKER